MPDIDGVVLLPGAGGSKNHSTLIALEDALHPIPVLRYELSYTRQGKRVPPRAPKLVHELTEDCSWIANELGCEPNRIVFGGRSMGGRICSMAVAEGMPSAGLLLLSYPLHPPKKPDELRTGHFTDIDVPCLFVSSDNDPFGSPNEFRRHLRRIKSSVDSHFVEGGGHDPSSLGRTSEIVEHVSDWLTLLGGT
ncbi:MAG: dienelactone hydrolase [Acidimicrobiaceae bacterium]|nr:dienelactone hydrolase [Acidimicrobiaceae bacterium]